MLTRTLFFPGLTAALAATLAAQPEPEWTELTDHLRTTTGQFSVAAVADIDLDGRTDLLLAGSFDALLRNFGHALFEDRTSGLPAGPGVTVELRFFDADGDGDPDLLRLMGGFGTSNQDRLYINGGKPGFKDVTATQMPTINANSRFAVAGDVDGDKDQDLVIASDQGVFLLLNNGTGTFTDQTSKNMPGVFRKPNAAELALVDIDGDGDLDLLLANTRTLATVDVIYTNDGKGKFSEATRSNYKASRSPRAFHLKVADFDGNKTPDMLLLDNFNLHLVSNDGKGIFTSAPAKVPPIKNSPIDMALLDIDADGDQDIALFHTRNNNQILRNDGNWTFTDITKQVQGLPVGSSGRVMVADLDGNKKDDVIYVSFNKRPELYLFEKANSFVNVTNHQTPKKDRSYKIARPGDMNGDGATDLVTSNGILFNDGRGIFAKAQNGANLIGQTFNLVVADLDADGDNDVYVGQQGTVLFPATVPAQNQLLLNDGKGNLTRATATNLPGVADFTNRVRVADIDGDKDLDLVVANSNHLTNVPSGIRLLINNGKGVFSDNTSKLLPKQSSSTRAALPGDLNGDGRLDLVAVDEDRLRVYLQNKSGTFDAAHNNVPGTLKDLRTGSLGDTNNDGKPDLVLAMKTGFTYLLNDGTGVLKPAAPALFPTITGLVREMDLVDVDDDGDLDVLMGMDTGIGLRLLLNSGGALQERSSALSNRPFSFSFAVADYDRDGDSDIVLSTNGGGLRLLFNLRRQLHAALPPVVGGRYVVDLHWRFRSASNTHAAILAFSPRAQIISLPPLGVLGIDTTLILPVPTRQLPGTKGMLEYAFRVPNDGKLKGVSVFAQAIMATPEGVRLTNTPKSTVR